MAYSFDQLKRLWIEAGGNPARADVAAAVALAESAGNPVAVSTAGAVGLWQIMPFHGAASTTDPAGNARGAVRISGNGSDWRPWDVMWSPPYRARSSGAVYLAPEAPAMRILAQRGLSFDSNSMTGNAITGGIGSITDAPGRGAPPGTGATGALGKIVNLLNPSTIVGGVADALAAIPQALGAITIKAVGVLLGAAVVALGAWRLVSPRR